MKRAAATLLVMLAELNDANYAVQEVGAAVAVPWRLVESANVKYGVLRSYDGVSVY